MIGVYVEEDKVEVKEGCIGMGWGIRGEWVGMRKDRWGL